MHVSTFPDFVSKYFWGDDLSTLSLEKHKKYIVQTILDIGDQKAVSWLFSVVDRMYIKSKLSNLRLNPQSSRFWSLYFE